MRADQQDLKHRLQIALAELEKHQGVKEWPGSSNPLDSLLLTLLSQNTNDNLRDKAYANLRRRYPRWDQVLRAPVANIEKAIHVAGLSRQKAARMKDILAWVKREFGGLSLAGLETLSDDQALELLTSQKGIGIKTAAVVLMFAMGRDLCPVDTHVHRIAGRLGWVSAHISAEKTFDALRPCVPNGKGYSLHMNLLQFGRTICHARQPRCSECFLYDQCTWEKRVGRRNPSKGY